tara:strand:- start:204 stop:515 length:312 start_codon:yes stop_codon:yes gene_type:complete
MAIEYTWTIGNLEYNNDSDKGVVIAHWRCTGVDGEYSASAYSTQSFTPDPSADGYVAYADLTEATVIGWVQNAVDQVATEASIASKIEAQKNPATLSGTPWNS